MKKLRKLIDKTGGKVSGKDRKLVDLPYVIFYVRNISDLLVFYKQAFDLSPSFVHESGHFAELFSGTVTLAFRSETMASSSLPQEFQSNSLNSSLQAFEISFHTKDVDAVYERAIRAGAADIASPHMTPWGQKAANVRDPAGILIEITEYPKYVPVS
jgi:lactoylglutathione lyase